MVVRSTMSSTLARTGPEASAAGARTSAARIASFPPILATNPYQRLFYDALASEGFSVVKDARFRVRWLLGARNEVGVLHFHWPQGHYRFGRGPTRLRVPLDRAMLGAFAVRLAAARLLRYRIVWTVHQVYPHDSSSRSLDRLGGRILARFAHVLITHDRTTAELARKELGRAAGKVAVVPHGSYVGVYPPGRRRYEVRAELGVPPETFLFLCLGDLRAYKDVEMLLEAFTSASLERAALVVAGAVRDERVGRVVADAAAADSRVKPLLGFVPPESVAELYAASDAAVVARSDGGTSGSLVLALSQGTPVVTARLRAYDELTGGERAGWFFDAGSAESLRETLERAVAERDMLAAKGAYARARAEALRWPEIAAQTAALIHGRREA
jgi:glycosyltransferase involved in cell wall biosynthesis